LLESVSFSFSSVRDTNKKPPVYCKIEEYPLSDDEWLCEAGLSSATAERIPIEDDSVNIKEKTINNNNNTRSDANDKYKSNFEISILNTLDKFRDKLTKLAKELDTSVRGI